MTPWIARAALAAAALGLGAPIAARDTIGVFGVWGAFRDTAAPRAARHCFAISRPVVSGTRGGSRPFASLASWPARGLRASLHVRLSRERDRSAGVTLTVGERRFALVANGVDAWAADTPSDQAIAAAIRAGRSMSVEAVGIGGRPFADVYALNGAATAMDAAALACLRR
ncbi:hypothetical protein SAMN05192583_1427 [Sphingomonas gellani]|uniref:Invasion protein IalB, involved in pathogenesis n=1 Tax=Sphingomonas gellani TaxID=1166340 RepID=A0A1H8C2H0_9SPHN|nr:invasion associated locus B family protein [Sphingomonas gellani]SEM89246.1 hypothetical protein SAMN05192583_1427 [Sphingomonas gellani]